MKTKLLILGATLCFSAAASAQTVREPEPSEISALEGTYAGTFLCDSGEMGMSMTLRDTGPLEYRCRSATGRCNTERKGKHELDAIINFFPTLNNPNAPSGAYRAHGEVNYRIKLLAQITLEPDVWIDQPEKFGASGLEASIVKGNVYGKPTAGGCLKLRMRKLRTEKLRAGSLQ